MNKFFKFIIYKKLVYFAATVVKFVEIKIIPVKEEKFK